MPYSDKQRKAASHKAHATHQDRVNQQIFHAMELLGRRLERTEVERNRIAKRIGHLESCAKHDPKTGRYFLPVETTTPPQKLIESKTPKWVMGGTMLSTGLAIAAMVMILSAEPALTPSQQRVLNSPQFASLMTLQLDKKWHVVEVEDHRGQPAHDLVAMAKRLDALKAEEKAQEEIAQEVENEIVAELTVAEQQAQVAEITTAKVETEQRQADIIAAAATVKAVDLAKTEPAAGTDVTPEKIVPVSPEKAKIVISQAKPPKMDVAQKSEKPRKTSAPLKGAQEHVGKAKTVSKPVETTTVATSGAVEHVSASPKAATPKPASTSKTTIKAQKHVEHVAQKQAATQSPKTPTRTVFQTAGHGIATDLEQDPSLPERFKTLEKRSIEGIPEAQHDLATLYAAGDAVKRDFKRAGYWFKKAADNGIANAHYNLGVIYHQGLGVKANVQEALGWYHNAAELGHPEALYNLGIAYVEGIGAEMDIERGASYFKRAAHAGVAQAAFNLAVLYESSFMGGADNGTALEWYELSANLGHNEGYQAVKRLKGLENTNMPISIADLGEAAVDSEHLASQRLVAIIQEKLVGYQMLPTGSVSGQMDAKTEDAIRAYQRQAGLNINGKVSKSLLKHMVAQ